MSGALPVVYLAAGEGTRLKPLTDDRPKAMIEVGGTTLAERSLTSLRAAGATRVVAVTGYRPRDLDALGELIGERRHNPRFAEHGNVYSLWCARDVVSGGCLIVNSDVLFEDEIARRLLALDGSAVLCDSSHGVDEESMKAVSEQGRLVRLSKDAPVQSNPEYIGLARVDPADGPLLVEILDGIVATQDLDVYYEDALEQLARRRLLRAVPVDGLAWIEIDDHADLERARGEVLARVP
jgi:choline kinase